MLLFFIQIHRRTQFFLHSVSQAFWFQDFDFLATFQNFLNEIGGNAKGVFEIDVGVGLGNFGLRLVQRQGAQIAPKFVVRPQTDIL